MATLSRPQARAFSSALARGRQGLTPSTKIAQYLSALAELGVDLYSLVGATGYLLYSYTHCFDAPTTEEPVPLTFLPGENVRAFLLTHQLEQAADLVNALMRELYSGRAELPRPDVDLPPNEALLAGSVCVALSHSLKLADDDPVWGNEEQAARRFLATHGEEIAGHALAVHEALHSRAISPTSLKICLSYLTDADAYGTVAMLEHLERAEFIDCGQAHSVDVPGLPFSIADLVAAQGMKGDPIGLSEVGVQVLADKVLKKARSTPAILQPFVEVLRSKYWETVDLIDPPFRPMDVVERIWQLDQALSRSRWGQSVLTADQHETLLLCWQPGSYWPDADYSALPQHLPILLRLGHWSGGERELQPWLASTAADLFETWWLALRSAGLNRESESVFCIGCLLEDDVEEALAPELFHRFGFPVPTNDSLLPQIWRAMARQHGDGIGPLATVLRRSGRAEDFNSDPLEQTARARLQRQLGTALWLELPVHWKQHLLSQERLWITSPPSASTSDCSHLVLSYFKFIELQILDRHRHFINVEDRLDSLNAQHFISRPLAAPVRASISDALRVIKLGQKGKLQPEQLHDLQVEFPGLNSGLKVNTLFDLKAWRELAAHVEVQPQVALEARSAFLDPEVLRLVVELLGPRRLRTTDTTAHV